MNYDKKAHDILNSLPLFPLITRKARKEMVDKLAAALAEENREGYAAGRDSERSITRTYNVTITPPAEAAGVIRNAVMRELGQRVVQSTVDALKRDKTVFSQECKANFNGFIRDEFDGEANAIVDKSRGGWVLHPSLSNALVTNIGNALRNARKPTEAMELTDAFKTLYPSITLEQLYDAGWTDSSLFAANYALRKSVSSGAARDIASVAKLTELQFTYNSVARQWVEPVSWVQNHKAAETLRRIGGKWSAQHNAWVMPRPSFAFGGYYPTVLPAHFNINMIDGMVHFASGSTVSYIHVDKVPELRNLLARAVDAIVGAPAKA